MTVIRLCTIVCLLWNVSASCQDSSQYITKLLLKKVDSIYQQQNDKFQIKFRFDTNQSFLTPSKAYSPHIKEVNKIPWSRSGITYQKVQGANIGVNAFTTSDSIFSYLANSTNEVILVDRNNTILSRFSVPFGCRDVYYDKDQLYVLGQSNLFIYSLFGHPLQTIELNEFLPIGIENIYRKKDSTFLQLGGGISLPIEYQREKVNVQNLQARYFDVNINILNDTSYILRSNYASGSSSFQIHTERNIAGLFEVYADSINILIDEQTYVRESPIQIERNLIWIKKINGPQLLKLRIPNCYYVKTNRDFFFKDNTLFHLVTAPDAAHIFKITFTQDQEMTSYPKGILDCNYHYNYHLLKENTRTYDLQANDQ